MKVGNLVRYRSERDRWNYPYCGVLLRFVTNNYDGLIDCMIYWFEDGDETPEETGDLEVVSEGR